MQNLHMVPCWLRLGRFFRNYVEMNDNDYNTEIDEITQKFFKFTSEISSMDDFKRVYELSFYWILDRLPYDLYIYGFLNTQNVLIYLNELETPESNKVKDDIRLNLSLIKYKNIIQEDYNIKEIIDFYKKIDYGRGGGFNNYGCGGGFNNYGCGGFG